eukprot:scpid19522/ scgid13573/ Staphylococcal nuclease domain-containing protein 1; 100 kDa coactivator; p100 co-activator
MAEAPRTQYQKGVVKQILSGDSLIIRGQPRGGPPPERTVGLSGITAPRLARRQQDADNESTDEPWAWECREFLRTLLVGKEVTFTVSANKTPSGKEFGSVFITRGGELQNVVDSLLSEGLAEARKTGPQSEEMARLTALEEEAKAANRGKWGPNPDKHIRDVKSAPENLAQYVDKHHGKEISCVVEYVRDACTMRVCLLPGFETVGVMLSGIKCPGFRREDNSAEPFAQEAKFFVESRLLQRDVKLRIEGSSNAYIMATIIHPAGNISEALLQEGFAHCVDWSIGMVTTGKDKLRAAERAAKEKRVRRWKDFKPSAAASGTQKQYSARVMEVINADALRLKLGDGSNQKIFLSSLRGPRQTRDVSAEEKRNVRQLYDVPYMFEAREFLRTKLIHKKVNVTVDYVRPSQDGFPERICATVLLGETNIAEALISKGLATVLRHRQDDEERSLSFDDLLTAENRAKKNNKGLHQKKEGAAMRISDLSSDSTKAKQFLSSLQRQGRISGVVEFVASGSRLRVFLPKDTSIITLLLAGVSCPRAQSQRGGQVQEAEPFGDEAHAYTRDLCLQREISIQVDNVDRAGNFIGWALIDEKNVSLELVTRSLAKVHFSADKSPFSSQLYAAEAAAQKGRDKIWLNYEPPQEVPQEEAVSDDKDRKVSYQKVVVSHAESSTSFYVQKVENGPQLEGLMDALNTELNANPPTVGAYSPKRNDKCAAKYSDGQWYRVQVEKIISKDEIQLHYMDYGNKETQRVTTLCPLPSKCSSLPAQATLFSLACARPPPEEDWQEDSLIAFQSAVEGKELDMNVEYRVQGTPYVSLHDSGAEVSDICKRLLLAGLIIVDKRRDKRLEKLVSDYVASEQKARTDRVAMWVYGDVTADDANEFGYRSRTS